VARGVNDGDLDAGHGAPHGLGFLAGIAGECEMGRNSFVEP
jgi:hypothetical protein